MKNKRKNSLRFFAILGLLLTAGIVNAQFYNGLQMQFGKNRVQYKNMKDRFWSFYRFEKFDTYFYLGGKELSNYTARYATKQITEIEKVFDYTLDERIQFIVYNKLSDLKESNIGLETDQQYNIGGVTFIVGTKVVLYFNGDHRDFERQIKAGITKVILDQMMYGGNIKDVVRNSTLLNLPEWYTQGLISYMSTEWDADMENHVKDGILTGKYEKFNRLTGDDARYAGHSIWRYVADTYGKQVISNILYMTKISRNIDSGFLFVLGVSLKNLTYEWLAHYDKLYYERSKNLSLPTDPLFKKVKPNLVFTQLKASPNGQYNIFATNDWGKYRVFMQNVQTGKKKRIIRIGHKLEQKTDYSFPLLAWHPSSQLFSMITEHKGKILLTQYNLQTKKKTKRPLFNFEKILDFSYSDDGKELAMSAVQFGQSDIFIYNLTANTYHQVTKDIWDDLNPHFINKSREVVFASNRNNDTIRLDESSLLPRDASTDIYIYNYKTKAPILKRITQTANINETQPSQFDSAHIAYLSDANGVNNRFLAKMDSVISYVDTIAHYSYIATSFPVTNYPRNIIQQDIQAKSGKISEIIFNNGKYFMYQRPVSAESAQKGIDLKDSQFRVEQKSNQKQEDVVNPGSGIPRSRNPLVSVPHEEEQATPPGQVDINNYTFEGEKRDSKQQKQVIQTEVNATAKGETTVRQFENGKEVIAEKEKEFVLPKLRNYDVAFYTDYVVTQLNNNFINSSYQKFTGGGAVFFNPGINGLFKIGISDVMEDYKITGGFRFAANLNSNEYFLSYQNFKNRLDQQIVFHRQSFLNIVELSAIKVHTHTLTYSLKYPFSEVASLRGSIIGRTDQEVNLSTDLSNLQEKNRNTYLGGLKMEYVFDNTVNRGLNLYNGWRYKIFGEYYQHVDKKSAHFFVIGMDVRHYKKIHRDLIWANRFAASTSFGTEKLIYYLGGVDNWFSPKFDNSTSIDYSQNYQYQTVATNMRGFYQNVRNGNSFAVFNSEIRLPLFKYIMNRPIRSDFLTNFQVVAFGDIGTAWTGLSPYSEDNFLNTQTIQSGNLVIKIKNSKEPIVGGYGFGLRSRILGYFIRADYAWGVEDGRVLKPLLYVSLSLDF